MTSFRHWPYLLVTVQPSLFLRPCLCHFWSDLLLIRGNYSSFSFWRTFMLVSTSILGHSHLSSPNSLPFIARHSHLSLFVFTHDLYILSTSSFATPSCPPPSSLFATPTYPASIDVSTPILSLLFIVCHSPPPLSSLRIPPPCAHRCSGLDSPQSICNSSEEIETNRIRIP